MNKFFFFSLLAVAFTACTKAPTACISGGEKQYFPTGITLNNCSSNASYFIWDLGNGEGSEASTLKKLYATTGNKTIKLHTYSSDGRKENTAEKTVFLVKKVLDSIVVYGFDNRLFINPVDGGATELVLEINPGALSTQIVSPVLSTDIFIHPTSNDLPLVFKFTNTPVDLLGAPNIISFMDDRYSEATAATAAKRHLFTTFVEPYSQSINDLSATQNDLVKLYWHFE